MITSEYPSPFTSPVTTAVNTAFHQRLTLNGNAMVSVKAAARDRKLGVKVPIVVRLQGTNVEQGKKLLAESGLALISADGLDDAAKKVAEAAKGVAK